MSGALPQCCGGGLYLSGLPRHIEDVVPILAHQPGIGFRPLAISYDEARSRRNRTRLAAGQAGDRRTAGQSVTGHLRPEPSRATENQDIPHCTPTSI
jgi:hypothetical protein